MKQGKINLKPIREPSDQKADSKSTVLENDLLNHTAIINLMPLISIIIAVLPGIIRKSPSVEIAKLGILTLILTAASSFFIRMNADTILNKKFAKSIIAISYFVSLGLLLLTRHPENFNFWMLGGFVVAMLIDNKLGLLLHFNLSFILGISFSLQPETVIYLLVIGVLMSLLASSLRQKSTVIYAAIILLSTNVTLAFVINNFIFDKNAEFNYVSSFFSIFAVLIAAFLLCVLYDHIILKMDLKVIPETAQSESSAAGETSSKENGLNTSASVDQLEDIEITACNNQRINENPQIAINSFTESIIENSMDLTFSAADTVPVQSDFESWTSYDLLNEEGNILLSRLKDYSLSLYEHAILIGDISGRAAKDIGANEKLAKAGGLYHEIGKINGRDYIEEGIRIAQEYKFPKELLLILKQHNIKYDKPTSVEAAIVMLSDNVVSTIEYIEKTEDKKFTPGKIIDNIFQLRMDKGTFDSSGLSVKDFKQLKEFYQKEFNKH